MAEYTNLTTLEGLQPGDVITYDTTTTIDFKGCKVKVELYGVSTGSFYQDPNNGTKHHVASNGGISRFILDHSKLNGALLTFNRENSITQSTAYNTKRCDLIYGETDSLYYRIAVAGNAGNSSLNSTIKDHFGGGGGGVSGSSGNGKYPGGGGTQTSGGKKGDYYASAEAKGGFGKSGYYKYLNTSYTGGYGWYGGGAGAIIPPGGGSGGGSGFIIGYTTTTYPAGYLDDNIELQTTIVSAISEPESITGEYRYYAGNESFEPSDVGSRKASPKMVLTIVGLGVVTKDYRFDTIINSDGIEPRLQNYLNRTDVTELDLRDSNIRKIKSFCFYRQNFKSIKFPYNLQEIGNSAFYGNDIEELILPKTLTTIGARAFSNCSKLKRVIMPNSVLNTLDSVFFECSLLEEITLSDNLKRINSSFFEGCSSLKEINIPNSVTSIGNSAFRDCTSLRSITIPDSVTSIGRYAFDSCTSLTSIIYTGTMAEWENITLDSSWKENSGINEIICTDGVISYD